MLLIETGSLLFWKNLNAANYKSMPHPHAEKCTSACVYSDTTDHDYSSQHYYQHYQIILIQRVYCSYTT